MKEQDSYTYGSMTMTNIKENEIEEETEWNKSNAYDTFLRVLHLPHECDIDFIDEGGMSLIMWASLIQSYEAVKEIIRRVKSQHESRFVSTRRKLAS